MRRNQNIRIDYSEIIKVEKDPKRRKAMEELDRNVNSVCEMISGLRVAIESQPYFHQITMDEFFNAK